MMTLHAFFLFKYLETTSWYGYSWCWSFFFDPSHSSKGGRNSQSCLCLNYLHYFLFNYSFSLSNLHMACSWNATCAFLLKNLLCIILHSDFLSHCFLFFHHFPPLTSLSHSSFTFIPLNNAIAKESFQMWYLCLIAHNSSFFLKIS